MSHAMRPYWAWVWAAGALGKALSLCVFAYRPPNTLWENGELALLALAGVAHHAHNVSALGVIVASLCACHVQKQSAPHVCTTGLPLLCDAALGTLQAEVEPLTSMQVVTALAYVGHM